MKRLILVVVGLASFSSIVCAGPSSLVAFDIETNALIASGDPANGEALAGKGRCARCHGELGVSDDPEDTNIAGLRASYFYKQLKDYQTGNRDNRSMSKAVKKLDDQQMADLAAWYATLAPAPRNEGVVDPAVRRLVYNGDPSRLLHSCASCHGRNGQGGQYDNPALTGQNREYFITTMAEFKEGERANDVYSRMRLIAEVLSEEEIEALAGYYAPPYAEEATAE